MNFKYLFIVFVISTFNGNVFNQNNEFCDVFAKNGFQIDYGFGFGPKYVLFVIDHEYWILSKRSHKNELNPEIMYFQKTKSQLDPDLFGKQYKTAAALYTCINGCGFKLGLLKVNNH